MTFSLLMLPPAEVVLGRAWQILTDIVSEPGWFYFLSNLTDMVPDFVNYQDCLAHFDVGLFQTTEPVPVPVVLALFAPPAP